MNWSAVKLPVMTGSNGCYEAIYCQMFSDSRHGVIDCRLHRPNVSNQPIATTHRSTTTSKSPHHSARALVPEQEPIHTRSAWGMPRADLWYPTMRRAAYPKHCSERRGVAPSL